jgi:hypothetical protein
MDAASIAALTALITAIISVIIAVDTSRRGNRELDLKARELDAATKKLENETNAELRKLRNEVQQAYAGMLLGKRLEVYPALYHHLSRFIKILEFGSVTKSDLQELRAQIEQWDNQYSLYFTGQTTDVFHEFRIMIAELSELSDEEVQAKISSNDEKIKLRRRVAEIELALKSDLGIYVVEFPDSSKERFHKYEDIEHAVKQIDKS